MQLEVIVSRFSERSSGRAFAKAFRKTDVDMAFNIMMSSHVGAQAMAF
jgi:hypothetical protein